MLKVFDSSRLGPEELAPLIGVSGMTLRRWKRKGRSVDVPMAYEAPVREAVFKLIISGHLEASSSDVAKLLDSSVSKSFEACIKSLGVNGFEMSEEINNESSSALMLAEVGHGKEHRDEVDAKQDVIEKFKSFGESWRSHLGCLLNVIRSKRLSVIDKVVAYGALFYLLCPFDLIPDSIPVVGYIDDFAMIAIAVAFYTKRFPHLLGVEAAP